MAALQNNGYLFNYAIIVRGTGKIFGSVFGGFHLLPRSGDRAVRSGGHNSLYLQADAKASCTRWFLHSDASASLKSPIVGISRATASKVPPGK